ncbi:MAG: molecular chaperone DnaJ [Actinobacteria bacterium]|nr:MAG: molecular chaperone DnaJ [Actinomycetota bacterium]
MRNKRDYYGVLGLSRDCTLTDIKREYRKLARKYHPDLNNGDPKAEEKFKEISEAYAVLSNEDKRRQYDQFGFSRSLFEDFDFGSVFSEFDFGDIFDRFFGAGFGSPFSTRQRSRRKERGSDISVEMKISFKESAYGVKKEIEYNADDICEVCRGKGSAADDGIITCRECSGTGKVRTARQTLIGNIITTSTCRDCGGTGKIIKDPCKKCRGRGYYSRKRKVKLDIPAGIHDGDRLRVSGKGNSLGKDSINGDLFVTVRVMSYPGFKRDGNDVLSNIEISFAQAALGCRLEVETLDGKEEINIKPGTQPNKKIILKSRGIIELNGYRRGDHIINIEVKIPTKLTKEEIILLKKYADGREEAVDSGSHGVFSNIKNAFKK